MSDEYNNEALITSAWVRLTCLENILISKGVIDAAAYTAMVLDITTNVMRRVLKNVKTPEEIDAIIKELSEVMSELSGTPMEKINTLMTDSCEDTDEESTVGKVLGMSVHQSKGSEAPVVIILDLQNFPSEYSEDEEEEKRILYVAVTRAKDRLALFSTGYFKYEDKLFPEITAFDVTTYMPSLPVFRMVFPEMVFPFKP